MLKNFNNEMKMKLYIYAKGDTKMLNLLKRSGVFVLALLILMSIPIQAFAVPETDVQEWAAQVGVGELIHVDSERPYDDAQYDALPEYEQTSELLNIHTSAASVVNERLFNILSGGVPNIGSDAIWRISHEVGVPGEYVDVRIELYQTTTLGMGNAIFNLMYDPTVLTPAGAFVSAILRFDHSLLTPMQQIFYDMLREQGLSDAQIWEEFPHAIVNDASNLTAMEVVFHPPLFHPGHVHGEHIVNVNWETGVTGGFFGSGLFMHLRFRILPGVSAGSVGYVKF